MHAIMSEQNTDPETQTMLIEVVDQDPGTGTDVVIARYDINIPFPNTTNTMYGKAREALSEHGFRAGTWQDIGGCWRAPVDRILQGAVVFPLEVTSEEVERRASDMLKTPPAEANVTGLITRAALDRLSDGKHLVTSPWEQRTSVVKMSAPVADPSEADEMLAISQSLALRALKVADRARTEASVGGKDPKKNHTYMQKRAALDAHCEQLAHLMWTRKHHAAGHGALGKYPSAHEAEKYLRELAEKEN